MENPRLEELWGKLFKAKCPKDFFGEIDTKNKRLTKKFFQIKIKEVEEILEIKDPDESTTQSIYRIKSLFVEMISWAFQAIKEGTYNDCLTYRVKIQCEVRSYEGKKLFYLKNLSDKQIYFDRLISVLFEGYTRMDPVRLIRGNEIVKKGTIMYYGTHAASEYFSFNGIAGLTESLWADQYKIGDIFEVETLKFTSADDFGNSLISFSNVSKMLDDAFKLNDNQLTGVQLEKVAQNALLETKKTTKERNLFVLNIK